MFGTLRYVAQGDNPGYVSQVSSERLPRRGGGGEQRLACKRCRAKKLKCSGQTAGCTRCKASSSTCSYSKSTNDEDNSSRQEKARAESRSSMTPPSPAHGRMPSKNGSEIVVNGTNEENRQPSKADIPAPDEPSNSIDMPDWPSHLDSDEVFDVSYLLGSEVGQDGDGQHLDGDYGMSQVITPASFDFDSLFNEKLFNDSFFNTNLKSDSKHKLQSNPMLSPPDSSHLQNPSLASPEIPSAVQGHPGISHPYQKRTLKYAQAFPPHPSISSIASCHDTPPTPLSEKVLSDICQCLQKIASILEELETKIFAVDSSSIDGMMNFHQDVLEKCNTVLLCRSCTDRSERMMLLAMVSSKLVNLCEVASSRFSNELQSPELSASTSANPMLVDRSGGTSPPDELGTEGRSSSGSQILLLPQILSCGEYRVAKSRDWECLTKVLLFLQLRELSKFLKRMKFVSFIAKRETHFSMLNACELRVQKLGQGLAERFEVC